MPSVRLGHNWWSPSCHSTRCRGTATGSFDPLLRGRRVPDRLCRQKRCPRLSRPWTMKTVAPTAVTVTPATGAPVGTLAPSSRQPASPRTTTSLTDRPTPGSVHADGDGRWRSTTARRTRRNRSHHAGPELRRARQPALRRSIRRPAARRAVARWTVGAVGVCPWPWPARSSTLPARGRATDDSVTDTRTPEQSGSPFTRFGHGPVVIGHRHFLRHLVARRLSAAFPSRRIRFGGLPASRSVARSGPPVRSTRTAAAPDLPEDRWGLLISAVPWIECAGARWRARGFPAPRRNTTCWLSCHEFGLSTDLRVHPAHGRELRISFRALSCAPPFRPRGPLIMSLPVVWSFLWCGHRLDRLTAAEAISSVARPDTCLCGWIPKGRRRLPGRDSGQCCERVVCRCRLRRCAAADFATPMARFGLLRTRLPATPRPGGSTSGIRHRQRN